MICIMAPPTIATQNQSSVQTPQAGKSIEDRDAEVLALEADKNYLALEQHARTWLLQHPDDPIAWRALGIALLNQHKTEEGRKDVEHAIALKPDYARAWYTLGEIYKKQRDNAKVMDCYHRILKIDARLAASFKRNVIGVW